ncbi:hypothetical protein [Streptomyces sp. NPDC088785]|uniref:hypothetical protein n=1 Tax=Streptomyces sp. NPDC088785 TaxID=3365897 RepID=UPI0037F679AC
MLVDPKVLPATNSIALGGLGSGKSATGKVRARRESLYHDHQYVVIDSYGERDQESERHEGEWSALARDLGGMVIEAGTFTINPCSPQFPPEAREPLIRSLIMAVEPEALTAQAAHALQHALNSPKATTLSGIVEALQNPEEGRYPAPKLADWGEGAVLALTHYTDGSLRGLFDGPEIDLPPVDLPMISFDFTKLDRNSAAIPALMAAIGYWVEHVWLKQSTAVHRHLVLEEAWQILLSPATAELIQRLLKHSRRAALSIDVVMHTLSDLGDGRARDLARLIEVVYVGRLGPEEAAKVAAIFGLPEWAAEKIPTLDPGEAVWKIGHGSEYVDIIQTIRDTEEAQLTDTSTGRRRAQEAAGVGAEAEEDPGVSLAKADLDQDVDLDQDQDQDGDLDQDVDLDQDESVGRRLDVVEDDMPSNVIDTVYTGTAPDPDGRHTAALDAARAGRFSEAADLAAAGHREDIRRYGLTSCEASAWLITQAAIADLSGNLARASWLRATVARMGNDAQDGGVWYEQTSGHAVQWHQVPDEPHPVPEEDEPTPTGGRRRMWPYVAAIAALGIISAAVWQNGSDGEHQAQQDQKAAAYKGVSATDLTIDGVKTEALAKWSEDGRSVVVSAWVDAEEGARIVRIDSAGQSAKEVAEPLKKGQIPMPVRLEVKVPVKDRYESVRLTVAVGGSHWKDGTRAPRRTIELRSDRTATDIDTGKSLKQSYSKVL